MHLKDQMIQWQIDPNSKVTQGSMTGDGNDKKGKSKSK